jgi:hypothetical protein
MRWGVCGLRGLGILGLIVWVGGFTFYSAGVIPVLHDAMPMRAAGRITQRVTDRLNLAGTVTVLIWWVLIGVERRLGPSRVRIARALLLLATTLLLAALVWLHAMMDDRLAEGRLAGFYPWHRAYLIVSTIQWFVNLGLLGLSLRLWEQKP